MIRGQLLEELWAAYPGIIIDVCEVDPVRIVVRGQPGWQDTRGVVAAHVPDPDWGKMADPGIPEDIPIRERGTGNVYYVRVEGGALKLYDVEDKLVKRFWEVWK